MIVVTKKEVKAARLEKRKARLAIHDLEENFCKSCPMNNKSRHVYKHCITECAVGKMIVGHGETIAPNDWSEADDWYLLDFHKEYSTTDLAVALGREYKDVRERLSYLKKRSNACAV
ncbi:zinc-finger domain-containing protein [Psychrobacillus sp.]|uniref:zinc-finger domain-containing protein n=1 Tax=Psychrobacillus sp. TaxID=1871623 RepID=UPI0028BF42C9|nr:zinc-finger domain-containing protein [Psychrobacillus sp.]